MLRNSVAMKDYLQQLDDNNNNAPVAAPVKGMSNGYATSNGTGNEKKQKNSPCNCDKGELGSQWETKIKFRGII